MLHILEHALLDSIKILPFIFAVYFLIEYLEHKNNTDISHILMKTKKTGPLYGAFLGCIPQCGFSVIASDLFSKKSITFGTLIAIFIATSDEAIPILFSNPTKAYLVAFVVAIKFVIALIAGFTVDFIFKNSKKTSLCDCEHDHHHFHGNCENCEGGILKSTVIHSVKIFVFIFIVTFIFNALIEFMGEKTLSNILFKESIFQPLIASLIGLIPNCAASVMLTQGYLSGVVSFGSLIAGLSSGAGVGLLVLFKHNKNVKENMLAVLVLYFIGAISGIVIGLF
ncbi:MAG: hypothetical protein E7391_03445 [Ruminococcaceae bacterium]|nr:hypothetical protein [Oscillospiraceae bacterium]